MLGCFCPPKDFFFFFFFFFNFLWQVGLVCCHDWRTPLETAQLWLMNRFGSAGSRSFWKDAYSLSLRSIHTHVSRHWNLRIPVHIDTREKKKKKKRNKKVGYDTAWFLERAGFHLDAGGATARWAALRLHVGICILLHRHTSGKRIVFIMDDMELRERERGKSPWGAILPTNIESYNIFRHQRRRVRWSHTNEQRP